jgi:hypothetical protein
MEHIRAALAWVDLSIEQLVISLLILAVYLLYRKLNCLQQKYNQLDKLNLVHAHIIHKRCGIKTVDIHRTNDYTIHYPLNED